jgi:hypothetical protein
MFNLGGLKIKNPKYYPIVYVEELKDNIKILNYYSVKV